MTVSPLPNIPWEERLAGCSDVVWRYSANPIIPRNLIPSSNSIFNSAVVPFQGKFAGVFRCDNKKREMNLFVMGVKGGWESTKIGGGPVPIETPEGWLLFYHGVLTSCKGFVYSFGAALLDLDQPWKVIYRGGPYLLSPQTYYECVGDVPNVVFPCAALYDAPRGRIAIYYGGADTVTALAFARLDEVLDFLNETSQIQEIPGRDS